MYMLTKTKVSRSKVSVYKTKENHKIEQNTHKKKKLNYSLKPNIENILKQNKTNKNHNQANENKKAR